MEQNILQFIKRFELGKDCFLFGCCFWFAQILIARFEKETVCKLMYHLEENHFAAKINGKLYDASGVISEDGFIPFEELKTIDDLLYMQIYNDCILMKN